MARKKPVNPFYVLLVVVGTAFAVTACAYGVAAFRDLRRSSIEARDPSAGRDSLAKFIDERGNQLLTWELVALAAATVGAIATDGYWTRRAAAASSAVRKPVTTESES